MAAVPGDPMLKFTYKSLLLLCPCHLAAVVCPSIPISACLAGGFLDSHNEMYYTPHVKWRHTML